MGPVLLLNTATRDCRSWFTETSNADVDSIPKMLFDAGYDVWIGCTRGRDITLENANYNKNVPEQSAAYWNYSFAEIGKEDVASMVDEIIIQRP